VGEETITFQDVLVMRFFFVEFIGCGYRPIGSWNTILFTGGRLVFAVFKMKVAGKMVRVRKFPVVFFTCF